MKAITNFIKSLKFIFMPHYWLMNYPYNAGWDKYLNRLLDDHEFENIGSLTCRLGDVEIWCGNHPYASFSPYMTNMRETASFRPSRLTIQRAMKKLKKSQSDYYLNRL